MSEDKPEDKKDSSITAKMSQFSIFAKNRFTSALVKAEFRVLVDLRKSYQSHEKMHPEKTTERQIIQDRIERSAKFLAKSIDKNGGQHTLEKEFQKISDKDLVQQIREDLHIKPKVKKDAKIEQSSGPSNKPG